MENKLLSPRLLPLGHLLNGSLTFFIHHVARYIVRNLSSYYFVFVVFNIYNLIMKIYFF